MFTLLPILYCKKDCLHRYTQIVVSQKRWSFMGVVSQKRDYCTLDFFVTFTLGTKKKKRKVFTLSSKTVHLGANSKLNAIFFTDTEQSYCFAFKHTSDSSKPLKDNNYNCLLKVIYVIYSVLKWS